ncbi:unnamed protein product [Orchesella dallaii]|uniref:Gustatory receptor n=1 Tax=Orchesella dallaii TaxID=48710 RepID=A0ABP1Q557_9HEXA
MWKVLFFSFVVIGAYMVNVVYFALAFGYREMAMCTKAVFKLPKGFSSLTIKTRAESSLVELVSTGVLVFFFSMTVCLSVGCIFNSLDPIIIFLEEFLEDPLPLRMLSAAVLFIFSCNFIFSLDNYLFLLVFWLTRGVLAELAIKSPQNVLTWIRRGAFGKSLRTHKIIQFLFILINEIGFVAHPGVYSVGFFALIVTGTATVMGPSFLSTSLYTYLFFPGLFCICLSWVLTIASHVVAIYDQSILFKSSWLTEVEGKTARMQLRTCREVKCVLHGMGFLDRPFVTTFMDGVINNIVTLVILIGG